jgi:hypothetical protein
MAGKLMQYLYRPGWRLRCVDPPIAWLQFRDDEPRTVAIRLQLTCYLTSRYAGAVTFQDAQLRLVVGDRTFLVPLSMVTDVHGELLGKGFGVHPEAPLHVLAVFTSDAPDLVSLLQKPGSTVAVDVQALLNAATEYRKVADLELARPGTGTLFDQWLQVNTGRGREQ